MMWDKRQASSGQLQRGCGHEGLYDAAFRKYC
jgi:hypothetical protein